MSISLSLGCVRDQNTNRRRYASATRLMQCCGAAAYQEASWDLRDGTEPSCRFSRLRSECGRRTGGTSLSWNLSSLRLGFDLKRSAGTDQPPFPGAVETPCLCPAPLSFFNVFTCNNLKTKRASGVLAERENVVGR